MSVLTYGTRAGDFDELSAPKASEALVGWLPSPVWGRDELQTGEMWNSNSVISWLLARSGLATDMIRPPAGGRAPGWDAGVITARRQQSDLPVERDAQCLAGCLPR